MGDAPEMTRGLRTTTNDSCRSNEICAPANVLMLINAAGL